MILGEAASMLGWQAITPAAVSEGMPPAEYDFSGQ
jgi:hypothetical protein